MEKLKQESGARPVPATKDDYCIASLTGSAEQPLLCRV